MSLYYPPLDLDSTKAVFRLNLSRISKQLEVQGRKLDVDELSVGCFVMNHWQAHIKARWNGRQIRNACQTALALAEFEAQGGNHAAIMDPDAVISLEVKHFQKVADAYLAFMQYLRNIYGIDQDERAKEKFLRAGNDGQADERPPNPLLTRNKPVAPLAPSIPPDPLGPLGQRVGHLAEQLQYGQIPYPFAAHTAVGESYRDHPFPRQQHPSPYVGHGQQPSSSALGVPWRDKAS